MTVRILTGDCRETLPTLADASVQCCVTSPPYFALRDYGVAGQIGLESTLAEYIAALVGVFREVRRVLRDDGTLWLNMGDTYAGGGCGARDDVRCPKQSRNNHMPKHAKRERTATLPAKNLCLVPHRLAIALQDDGWYVRQDNVWAKTNPMPESAADRPSRAHEYVFLLSRHANYFYDGDSVRTPLSDKTRTTFGAGRKSKGTDALGKVASHNFSRSMPTRIPRRDPDGNEAGANLRSVWWAASQPFAGAHFATMPTDIVEPCILAGSRLGDTVLDPFGGTFTTAAVATTHGRDAIVCELNPAYVEMGRDRLGLFAPAREATR